MRPARCFDGAHAEADGANGVDAAGVDGEGVDVDGARGVNVDWGANAGAHGGWSEGQGEWRGLRGCGLQMRVWRARMAQPMVQAWA